MDRQEKCRFVQRYVERQRAYVPTYTKGDPWNESHGTPSKPLRGDEFGFDTPVLRPRVPVKKTSQLGQQAEPSKSRTHEAEAGPPQEGAPLGPQEPHSSNKDNHRPKRKKASTPMETDNERVARLAGRRERKRKKRAIVNPPQKRDEDSAPTEPPPKGRKNDQKAKKPAALALLYGFSATNVTKDRLTLKPAPSLGVFSKGKASAKKKVAATKKSSSKNAIFSESAFLNKPSERAADRSRVDDDSDDSESVLSISNAPTPQVTRITNRTRKGQGKCAETVALKTLKAAARTTTESEVWDIELQSELPSSARDVSSEPGATSSAPVVLDPRKAQWSATLGVAEEHKARPDKSRTRNLSVNQSSLLARSDLHDELGIPLAVDAPSIHPSHSASQVGRRADTQPRDSHRIASKYFAKPEAVSVPQFAAESPRTSRSNDNLDFRTPDQDVQDPTMNIQTVPRVTSPINSSTSIAQAMAEIRTQTDMIPVSFPSDEFQIPDQDVQDVQTTLGMTWPINSSISVAQPVVELRTRSDTAPLEFPSDCSLYDDCYAHMEPLAGRAHSYFEPSLVEPPSAECHRPQQGTGWDLYRSQWCSSVGLAGDDVEDDFMAGYDPLAPEYEGALEEPVSAAELVEYDPGEAQVCESWSWMGGARAEDEDGSTCPGEDVAEFLEGRALLLGVPEWPRRVGLSGLAQAEMDVASRLRDHWRPLRLS